MVPREIFKAPGTRISSGRNKHPVMAGKQLVNICSFFIGFCLIQNVFSKLEDVTGKIGLGGSSDGVLAAFGDFNSDKKTDVFVIANSKGDL